RLLFSGTQIKFWAGVNPAGGQASISIDGQTVTTVDFYAPTAKGDTLLWTSPTLAGGPHSFSLRALSTHQQGSQGNGVIVDRVKILSTGADNGSSVTPCQPQPGRKAPTFIPRKGQPSAQTGATAAPTISTSSSGSTADPCTSSQSSPISAGLDSTK